MSETKPLLQAKAADEEAPEEPKGFDDGYYDWSNSFQALEEACMHASIYTVLGIVFYSYILDTKLSIIESLYFSVSCFTTVGYGDISPASSNAGMLFTTFFALYGVIIYGIFLGIFYDYVSNTEQAIVDKIKKGAKGKLMKVLHKDVDGVEEEEDEDEYDENDPVYHFLAKYDVFVADLYIITLEQKNFILLVLLLGIPILVGEKWSIVQALYWLAVTGTTIGLGDLTPTSAFSRFYCIGYIPLLVALLGKILCNIAKAYVSKRNHEKEEEFLNRALDASALDKMDTNADKGVSKFEFVIFMLKTLDRIDDFDLEDILALFHKLDKDGSGVLDKNDLAFIPLQASKLVEKIEQKKQK